MTKDEKIKINSILIQYANCYEKIEQLEKEITNLLDRKNELVDTLKGIRKREQKAVSELMSKYGDDATLDLQKMEIIKNG